MAARVVIDSNISLARVLPVPYADKANALTETWMNQGVELAAPLLFRYEVVAIIRRYVHYKILTKEEAHTGLQTLLSTEIEFFIDDGLLVRAFELATQFNRPTAYDSQYLAVAERLKCDFWTNDEKLFNAVHQQLAWVRWLGNFTGTA